MYHPSHHGFQSLFLYYTLNSSKIVQTQWRDSSPPSWGSSRAAPARAPPRRWAPGARAPSYFAPPPSLSSARRPFKTKKGKIFKRNKLSSGFHLCSFCSTSPFSRVSWPTPALYNRVLLVSCPTRLSSRSQEQRNMACDVLLNSCSILFLPSNASRVNYTAGMQPKTFRPCLRLSSKNSCFQDFVTLCLKLLQILFSFCQAMHSMLITPRGCNPKSLRCKNILSSLNQISDRSL